MELIEFAQIVEKSSALRNALLPWQCYTCRKRTSPKQTAFIKMTGSCNNVFGDEVSCEQRREA